MKPSFPPAPESPCVRNCCLDQFDVCLGCGRQLQEILRWHDADAEERAAILDRAQARRAERENRTGAARGD
jgi:uncharacterized protein